MLTLVDGSVELKDQLKDYKFRGEELGSMNFLEFMLDTYEVARESREEENRVIETPLDEIPKSRGRGRPRSTRIPYRDGAGKDKSCRIIRQQGHETLPRFVGKWFCRSDNDSERDLFRASMLMLLKPWRKLHELKSTTETFENAFESFMSQTNERCKRVVENVQYYYHCSDGAKAERAKTRTSTQVHTGEPPNFTRGDLDIDMEGEVRKEQATMMEEITNDDIERALLMRMHARERLYGESAVALGYDIGFFNEDDIGITYEKTARKVQPEEGEQIRTWEKQLKAFTREQIENFGMIRLTEEEDELGLSVSLPGPAVATTSAIQYQGDLPQSDHVMELHIERREVAILNEEQRRAHDIIEERLKEHITSE